MNIFYLDDDPYKAAEYQCDKHVVKMIVETAQLLSSAWHENEPGEYANLLYKSTHRNHPCAIWTRTSKDHYRWLFYHFYGLATEYTKRYKKTHKTFAKLGQLLIRAPENFSSSRFADPPQCMPEEYKHTSTIHAYRQYYAGDKSRFAKWSCGEPWWWEQMNG